MSNLALRVLTAVVALPLLAALVAWREPLGFGVFVLVVAGLALTEYATIALPAAPRWVLAALVAVAALVLFEPGVEITGAGARLGQAAFGVFYLGALPVPLALLHR